MGQRWSSDFKPTAVVRPRPHSEHLQAILVESAQGRVEGPSRHRTPAPRRAHRSDSSTVDPEPAAHNCLEAREEHDAPCVP